MTSTNDPAFCVDDTCPSCRIADIEGDPAYKLEKMKRNTEAYLEIVAARDRQQRERTPARFSDLVAQLKRKYYG